MPKFSIIVPMYNVESYIAECIDSVLKQTYGNFELILVDDESSDQTLNIAESYAKNDHRITVVKKLHGGLPQTRNYGLNICTGEYIILLDGDDYFDLKHLEKVVSVLEKYDFDMCIANNHINFTKNSQNRIKLFSFQEAMNNFSIEECIQTIFNKKNKLPAAAVLTIYRTAFWKQHSIKYEESYACSEDLDIFLHSISVAKKIKFIGHEFYFYRQDNANAMTQNLTGTMFLSRLSIYKKWYDYYKNAANQEFDCNIICECLSAGFKDNIAPIWLLPNSDIRKKTVQKYVTDNSYIWKKHSPFFIQIYFQIAKYYIRRTVNLLLALSSVMINHSRQYQEDH